MGQKIISNSDSANSALIPLARPLDGLNLSRCMLIDIVAVIDVILVVGAAFFINWYYVQYTSDTETLLVPLNRINYLSVTALVTAILYLSLQWRGHYSYEDFEQWDLERGVFRLGITVVFSFGVSLLVIFMLKESAQFSRIWVFSWCTSTFILLLVSRLFWIKRFKEFAKKGMFRRRILLLGSGDVLERAHKSLLSKQSLVTLTHVEQVILGDSDLDSRCSRTGALASALNNVVSRGQSDLIDEVVIALPRNDSDLLAPILQRLRALPIDLRVALDFGSFDSQPIELGRIGATNVVSFHKKPISEWNLFLKAIEDYTFALLSVLIFLPAMVAIAVAIKLDSEGPVLFRQRRHGSNHKIIHVMKFRTMSVLEDGDSIQQARRDDTRVTRVGRFLRRTSMDELPQLFNVLLGNMSLVGPRPHALAHNTYYSAIFEDYASRHRVKPGITGWAQVNGARGEITDPELMEQRVRYDLEYIDNWSIWFDLKILILTPLFGFISKRAY
jgi:putative colanic acid biosynthesis UDP-glucose lipid carrier transferase